MRALSNQCQAIPYSIEDSASTESDAAFDFCKAKLQRCIETHTACQKRCIYRYPLLKRVIDIRCRDQKVVVASVPYVQPKLTKLQLGDGQEDSFHLRLFELGHGQSLEYVTLSHCWRQKQIITTTENTLTSRLQSIPWAGLSKTFQEESTLRTNSDIDIPGLVLYA